MIMLRPLAFFLLASSSAAALSQSPADGPPPTPSQAISSSAAAAPPGWGSDSCSTPDVIPLGQSEVFFINDHATTGSEGQGWSMCQYGPWTLIEKDVWFLWTAPATGTVDVYTCNGGEYPISTRFALYAGTQCPGLQPIECTTFGGCDSNWGGWVSFEVEQGSVWLVQVGSIPGTPSGLSRIRFHMNPSANHVYRYDASSLAGGFGHGPAGSGEFLWLNRFNAQAGADSLVQVDVAFGTQFFTSVPMVDGTPATVAVWADPDQDGNPADAVLLSSVTTAVQNADTGMPVTVFLPEPVPVQGKFFVGAIVALSSGQTPAAAVYHAADHEGGISPGGSFSWSERAWVGFAAGGTIDLDCLGCLSPPPKNLFGTSGTYGNFIVRAQGGAESNTYCFGDGSGSACPCGNTGGAGSGCANSSGAGALLWSTGSIKVSTNDFALRATHLPLAGGIGLAIAGSQPQAGGAGMPFQDGLLCVGGTIWRYPAQAFSDSLVQTSVVSASNGLITAGSTWYFQVWYRDTVGACGGSTGNLSNALSATFKP